MALTVLRGLQWCGHVRVAVTTYYSAGRSNIGVPRTRHEDQGRATICRIYGSARGGMRFRWQWRRLFIVRGRFARICYNKKGKGAALTVNRYLETSTRNGDIVVVRFLGKERHERLSFLTRLSGLSVGVFHFRGRSRKCRRLGRRRGTRRGAGVLGTLGFTHGIVTARRYSFLLLSRVLTLPSCKVAATRTVNSVLGVGSRDVRVLLAKQALPSDLHGCTSDVAALAARVMWNMWGLVVICR